MAINEQAEYNAYKRQQMDQIQSAGQQSMADVYKEAIVSGTSLGQISPGQIWDNTIASGTQIKMSRNRETVIIIEELENGRLVRLGGKRYIVPTGTPLIDVIGQALVETKLEE